MGVDRLYLPWTGFILLTLAVVALDHFEPQSGTARAHERAMRFESELWPASSGFRHNGTICDPNSVHTGTERCLASVQYPDGSQHVFGLECPSSWATTEKCTVSLARTDHIW